MNVLGFDTSLRYLTVVSQAGDRFYEVTAKTTVRHAANLLPTIDESLKRVGMEIEDAELLIVGIGPGSFTGIRVGLATAKGFMISLRVPVVGVSTTELLAANTPERTAAVCVPARKGYVYLGVYEHGKPVSGPDFVGVEEVEKALKEGRFKDYPLVGEGWNEITERNAFRALDVPRGLHLLELGLERFQKGDYVKEPEKLLPLYVERPIAEIRSASS